MQINIHKINLSFQKRALFGNIAINLIQMIHCILKLNLYFNKVEFMLFFFFLEKLCLILLADLVEISASLKSYQSCCIGLILVCYV